MKFGAFYAYWTHEWNGDYRMFASKVKNLGFDILEISAASLIEMPVKEIDELKAITKDLGISITSNIGPPKDKDIASKDRSVREAGIRFLTDIMKAMDRLDSRVLAGVLYTYWPYEFNDLDKQGMWERGVQSTRILCKTAEELGIDYCLEVVNRFETNILNTCKEALQYCKDVGSKNAKMLLDTFHMNIEEDSITDAIYLAGDYLGHFHAGEGNRNLPGRGSLPWSEIGNALRGIGYDKGIVMEPFITMGGQIGKDVKVWRDLSGGADLDAMDEGIKESLTFLKRAFLGG